MSPTTLDIGYLEPVLQRLASGIGLDATMRLVEHCSGVPVYFPKDLAPDHWLAQLLGLEAAREATRILGPGEHHVLPRAMAALRQARNSQMAADRQELSIRGLARRYGLTRRGVYKALAQGCAQPEKVQDSLFD